MLIIYILLGYFISNLVTFIVAIISKFEERTIINISFGFTWLLILLIRFDKVIKIFRKKYQKEYKFYKD